MTTSRPLDHDIGAGGSGVDGGGARRQATVSASATSSISGTAARSANATARGPRQTIAVASTPSATAHAVSDPTPMARAHADAAMTLLSAIQAKFVAYSRTATRPAPRTRSAGRAAMIEGTRRRDPSGASTATRAAPAMLPTAMSVRVVRTANDAARLDPTWNVVATMFAPTKMRNRSKTDWICSDGAAGRVSAACTKACPVSYNYRMGKEAISVTLDAENI